MLEETKPNMFQHTLLLLSSTHGEVMSVTFTLISVTLLC